MNLNKRVSLERRATTQDDAGQVVDTWAELAKLWADIRPISGREFYGAQGKAAEVTHEIMLRYRDDVRPSDRIRRGSRTFDIISAVNVNERNLYLKLRAIEKWL